MDRCFFRCHARLRRLTLTTRGVGERWQSRIGNRRVDAASDLVDVFRRPRSRCNLHALDPRCRHVREQLLRCHLNRIHATLLCVRIHRLNHVNRTEFARRAGHDGVQLASPRLVQLLRFAVEVNFRQRILSFPAFGQLCRQGLADSQSVSFLKWRRPTLVPQPVDVSPMPEAVPTGQIARPDCRWHNQKYSK
mgnify:CR=1 FL=1